MKTKPIFLVLVVFLNALPSYTFAQYLDPGTGSYLFQLLIAGGTALVYVVIRFKVSIFEYLNRLFNS